MKAKKRVIIYDFACKMHRCALFRFCHSPNSTSTQPQLNSTELGLTWKWLCTPPTPPPPPPPPKLNFLHKEPQINLWCCLNNNINIRDNNNKKTTSTTSTTTTITTISEQNNLKTIGCDLIVISLVSFFFQIGPWTGGGVINFPNISLFYQNPSNQNPILSGGGRGGGVRRPSFSFIICCF